MTVVGQQKERQRLKVCRGKCGSNNRSRAWRRRVWSVEVDSRCSSDKDGLEAYVIRNEKRETKPETTTRRDTEFGGFAFKKRGEREKTRKM